MTWYLICSYFIGFLFLLILYLQDGLVLVKDVVMWVLAPLSLPVTLFISLLGHLVDLNQVFLKRE